MKSNRILIVAAALLAACQSESTGTIKLALPQGATLRTAADAPSATFEEATVGEWTVTVTGEDMVEPVVVTTDESEVTVKVPAGLARVVHVSARGEEVNGIVQGYDGETTVDVPEEGNADAVVDVFRSVSVIDANQPVGRDGKTVSATAPDVESLSVTLGAEAMQVYVSFSNDVAAPWNASATNSLRGLVEVDTDRNPLTGDVSLVQARHRVLRSAAGEAAEDLPLGVDFAIDLTPADTGFVRLLIGDVAKPIAANFGARRLSVTVPYAEVGGAIAAMRFAALLSDRSGAADFVPEKDYVEIAVVATPAPEPKLTAITKFTGNFITTIDRAQGSALPVLRSSVGGFKAAWTTGKGYDYATSENGEVFTIMKSVALPSPRLAMTVDLAVDELGNATVVSTEKAYTTICGQGVECFVRTSVLQDSAGAIHDVVYTDDLVGATSYSVKSKVAMVNGKAFVTEPHVDAGLNYVYLFEGGKRTAKTEVLSGESFVNNSLTVRAGVPVLTLMQTVFAAQTITSISESVGQAGAIAFGPLTHLFDAATDALYDLSVAGNDAGTHYMTDTPFPTYYDLQIFDANKVKANVVGANFTTFGGGDPVTSFNFDTYVAPELAVSAGGRVAAVWHAGGMVMAAPPPMRLAPGDAGDEIYYAEKLPGATTFSAPMLVGKGTAASLAFDAQERPVVLVVKASISSQYPQAPVGSQFVHVYRGE